MLFKPVMSVSPRLTLRVFRSTRGPWTRGMSEPSFSASSLLSSDIQLEGNSSTPWSSPHTRCPGDYRGSSHSDETMCPRREMTTKIINQVRDTFIVECWHEHITTLSRFYMNIRHCQCNMVLYAVMLISGEAMCPQGQATSKPSHWEISSVCADVRSPVSCSALWSQLVWRMWILVRQPCRDTRRTDEPNSGLSSTAPGSREHLQAPTQIPKCVRVTDTFVYRDKTFPAQSDSIRKCSVSDTNDAEVKSFLNLLGSGIFVDVRKQFLVVSLSYM